jgi:hypothetical protein
MSEEYFHTERDERRSGTGNSHIILMIYRGSLLDQKQGHLSKTIETGICQRSISILREMRGDQGREMALDEGRGVEEGHLFFLDLSPRLKISLHFFQVPSLAGAVDVDEISGEKHRFFLLVAGSLPPSRESTVGRGPACLRPLLLEEGKERGRRRGAAGGGAGSYR